jgi:hypothetical protein
VGVQANCYGDAIGKVKAMVVVFAEGFLWNTPEVVVLKVQIDGK